MEQRLVLIAAGAALLALVGGTYAYTQFQPQSALAACRGGTVAGDIGGPFTLVSETGATVTDQEVITKPSLIYFGYTFCPDVCPLHVVRNADATALLEEQGHDVTPVFISVDPGRDTAQVLDDYTYYIHEDMIGLTGSEEQIDAAAKAYRAYYRVHEHEPDDEFYLVDHSTFTYLVMPGEGFVDFYRGDVSAEEMANRVSCAIEAV
ncbi:MAG: SCO family protein [Pseudomonadota bacterium]